jgi:hypothetical protein
MAVTPVEFEGECGAVKEAWVTSHLVRCWIDIGA